MQPNLKCFYWRDVVFTLTAVAVFPCFRVLKLVMLTLRMNKSNVKSPVFHAVLVILILLILIPILRVDLVFQRSTTVDRELVIR